MSPRATGSTAAGGGARSGVTAAIVVVLAVVMFLIVRARPRPDAFDPRSSRADGARALVLLLEQQGAEVEIGRTVPTDTAGRRVLVLDDRLDDPQRSALLDWVESGGVLVVADPVSTLHGGAGPDGGAVVVSSAAPSSIDGSPLPAAAEANVGNDVCTIPALQALRGVFVGSGLLFPVAPDESQCFGRDGHAFAIRRDLGDGIVVGLGDNGVLTNELIRFADNAGLATALLAPTDDARVTILLGAGASRTVDDIGSGEQSLGDLVRPSVWMAFAQLAGAFVMFAVAKGVRSGKVVDEPRAVPLEASELVRASGSMMRRARHHDRAGWLLRFELHRDLCRHLRLPHDSSVEHLVRACVERDGLDADLVRRGLTLEPVDDRSLLDLAQTVANVRARLDGRHEPSAEGATHEQ